MEIKNVTIFGATGFIGRYVVKRLAQMGATVRVATREIDKAKFLKPLGEVGQIVPVAVSFRHPESVARAVAGADAVINLTGILYEKRKNGFNFIHRDAAAMIARASRDAGVKKLVHLSAIGADKNSDSKYAQSKALGEEAVRGAFPGATILRPSVVFGPEDNFFNMFARLARIAPVLPLIGGGTTKFQPVYVGNVAEAVKNALFCDNAPGKIYELGGPQVYSFRDMLELMLAETGQKACLISVPYGLASVKAFFLEFLPKPLLTRDQVKLLKKHNVVSVHSLGFKDLGIEPAALPLILPTYTDRYKKGGRFYTPREQY